MGISPSTANRSPKFARPNDCFQRRVLLINPPDIALYRLFKGRPARDGVDVHENFTTAVSRILGSAEVSVVAWNSKRLRSEQWAAVLGNHLVILYFFNTPDDDETQESAGMKFRANIADALKCNPLAAVLAIQIKPPPVLEEDFESVDVPRAQRKPIDYAAIAKNSSIRYHEIYEDDDRAMFDLQCYAAGFLLPMELYRPIASLLRQLADACDFTEAYLLDGTSLLPLASSNDEGILPKKDFLKLSSLCHILSDRLKAVALAQGRGTVMNCVSLTMNSVHLYLGWACAPHAYALLVKPMDDPAALKSVAGDNLVAKNFDHFSKHFHNVVESTSVSRRYTPLP